MDDLTGYLNEQLEDPEFAKAWEDQKPERAYLRAIIAARIEQNLTQKELAEKAGIRQSNISRIETGAQSPTIATLQRIAHSIGKDLYVEFR